MGSRERYVLGVVKGTLEGVWLATCSSGHGSSGVWLATVSSGHGNSGVWLVTCCCGHGSSVRERRFKMACKWQAHLRTQLAGVLYGLHQRMDLPAGAIEAWGGQAGQPKPCCDAMVFRSNLCFFVLTKLESRPSISRLTSALVTHKDLVALPAGACPKDAHAGGH